MSVPCPDDGLNRNDKAKTEKRSTPTPSSSPLKGRTRTRWGNLMGTRKDEVGRGRAWDTRFRAAKIDDENQQRRLTTTKRRSDRGEFRVKEGSTRSKSGSHRRPEFRW